MQTSKFNKFIAILFTVIIVVGLCAGGLFYSLEHYVGAAYTAYEQSETAEELDNPYQGFYNVYGFRLSDSGDPLSSLDAVISRDGGNRLVLIEINLNEYSDSNISQKGLKQLDTILSKWSDTKKQMILRFLYDWDGKNEETEPGNIAKITKHMEQVASAVNKYAASVYTVQGIFVGNYGEMNNSKHLSDVDVKKLVNKLASELDPSIFLAVRTPSHWKIATSSNYVPQRFPAFDGSLISRLGLYNDGMLGSDSDLGTYVPANNQTTEQARADGIAFQKQLCDYVPSGGEVVIDNPYNDFDNAVTDLCDMHVSYLNSMYDADVLNKWKNTTYYGSDVFNGVDGYTYIKEHLGYRYELSSTALTYNLIYDSSAVFSCIFENVGFGSCMRELSAKLIIEGTDSDFTDEIDFTQDLRTLKSGGNLRLTVNVPVKSYKKGNYRVYLKITDAAGEPIKLATTLELSEKGYLVGQLKISRFL